MHCWEPVSTVKTRCGKAFVAKSNCCGSPERSDPMAMPQLSDAGGSFFCSFVSFLVNDDNLAFSRTSSSRLEDHTVYNPTLSVA